MENWKSVVEDARYEVSDTGRVRSIKSKHVLSVRLAGRGYPQVSLGYGRDRLIHRLVAIAFLPNEDGKPQVNHIDGDKRNNHRCNLEWSTASENAQHAYRTGLLDDTVCKNQPAVHPRAKPVDQIHGATIVASFKSVRAACRATGIDFSTVVGVLAGRFNQAGGFYWRYRK